MQEPGTGPSAADALVRLCDDAATFPWGVSYSCLPGQAEAAAVGRGFDVPWPFSLVIATAHKPPAAFAPL